MLELADEHLGIDDAARSDDRLLPGDHPTRGRADLEGLVTDDDRVTGVRPSLVTADEIGALREQVDDLAFTLVAPLRTDDNGGRHVLQSA